MDNSQLIPTGYSKMDVLLELNLKPEKLIEPNDKWLTAHEIIFIDSFYDKRLNIKKIIFKSKAGFYIEISTYDFKSYKTSIYHTPNQLNEVIIYIKQLNKLNLNYGD